MHPAYHAPLTEVYYGLYYCRDEYDPLGKQSQQPKTEVITGDVWCVVASMRLCMGSRRGFIIRMKIGNLTPGSMDSVSAASHCMRVRQRSTLGPSPDGQQYAVVHVTGYIKNWPPAGTALLLSKLHYGELELCST